MFFLTVNGRSSFGPFANAEAAAAFFGKHFNPERDSAKLDALYAPDDPFGLTMAKLRGGAPCNV